MKRIIMILVMLLMTNTVFAIYLPETKTMDHDQFSALYDAIDDNDGDYDEVMRFYWIKMTEYAIPNPTSRYPDGLYRGNETRADYEAINWSSTYAKNSLIGALAVEYDTIYAKAFLDGAKDHLIFNPNNPNNNERYLSLDSVWVEYSDGSWSDCLNYGQLLNDVAFTVDMLWYYINDTERDALYDKLT